MTIAFHPLLVFIFTGILFALSVLASGSETKTFRGELSISVNGLTKDGIACVEESGRRFLTSTMTRFLAKELKRSEVLRPENNGDHAIIIAIDENSTLIGYKFWDETSPDSEIAKTVIAIEHYPSIPENAACVIGEVFLYSFNLEQEDK